MLDLTALEIAKPELKVVAAFREVPFAVPEMLRSGPFNARAYRRRDCLLVSVAP